MSGWLTALLSFLIHDLIVLALIPVVLLRQRDPRVTVAWIFAILLMPFIGALTYLLFGQNKIARRTKKKSMASERARVRSTRLIGNLASPIDARGQIQLFRLLNKICPLPALAGNDIKILTDMQANYEEQLAAIAAARRFVHIEYYIFQPDAIGERFRTELIAAAKRGVEVRFVHDGLGSMNLGRSFLAEMTAAGVETAVFIPLNPLTRRWIFNFRNHRKIVVVDGEVGFIGGANIGKEYLGERPGAWGDTHLRIRGPAVAHLQQVFAEDWAFASGTQLTDPKYYPEPRKAGETVAQVVPGGPDLRPPIYHELYFSAVANAVEQVRIVTPYFVPSESVLTALKTAARRGVNVEILVPGLSTHPIVQSAARSYYHDLLESGVKIYEYTPGFMHSKVLTVDGRWSIVGTANFDNRSMILNFEIGVALYDVELTHQLDLVFEMNRAKSKTIDLAEWKTRWLPWRILENSAALFSPVL